MNGGKFNFGISVATYEVSADSGVSQQMIMWEKGQGFFSSSEKSRFLVVAKFDSMFIFFIRGYFDLSPAR